MARYANATKEININTTLESCQDRLAFAYATRTSVNIDRSYPHTIEQCMQSLIEQDTMDLVADVTIPQRHISKF